MFKYWKERVLTDVKKEWAVGGSCWHKVLELLGGKEDYNKNMVMEYFEIEWKKHKNDFYGMQSERKIHNFYMNNRIVKNVLDILDWLKGSKNLMKEFAFVVTINDRYKLNGIIDLVKEGWVYDYKFTKSTDNDGLQLYIYYKVMQELGINIKGVGFINGLKGVRKEFSIEEIIKEKDRYEKVLNNLMADKKFEPTPSYEACKWCSYRNVCRYKYKGGKGWISKI